MSVTQVTVATPSGLNEFSDSAMGSTVDSVKASSCVVYQVLIDNSANAAAASYVKLFNVASGSVTLGTTAPDEIIYCPANSRRTQLLFNNNSPGITFGTALSAACVTAGGTAGVTAPSSSVVVTILYV